MHLVIVESPAKAKTIKKYLGSSFEVIASFGHIRDLPSKNGSVDPDNDFAMEWEIDHKAKSKVKAIIDLFKNADDLILATDPDREGEAISWHIVQELKNRKLLKNKIIKRITFNSITKKSVLEAMEKARDIDEDLVDAYLARRALDYLVGFTLSPVLWRKLPGSKSAGRVQSVALRLICAREIEIEIFISQEYWTVNSQFMGEQNSIYSAKLDVYNNSKIEKFSITNEKQAKEIETAISLMEFSPKSVEAKLTKRNPYAPFTTSTLQQEAASKLGFSTSHTMRVAQKLYEGTDINGENTGLITYMRTDGINMAPEAVFEAREFITNNYDANYLPSSPRMYKSKAKNAQEAHECIRPTSFSRLPEQFKYLEKDHFALYSLIWKRALASQMASASFERTTITLENTNKDTQFRAVGSVLKFDGYLKLYNYLNQDKNKKSEENLLPIVKQGEKTELKDTEASQHFTEAPPRYSEASLVKKLEELGIGRPSTYASIISVLQNRQYVKMESKRFIPEDKGRLVTAFLENFFAKYVQYDFSAKLEEQLDEISDGKLDWKKFLADFWHEFSKAATDTKDLRITEVLDALNETLGAHLFKKTSHSDDPRKCPSCKDGILSLKVGRFGAFIGCSQYPECKLTRKLSSDDDNAMSEDKVIGTHPQFNCEILLKTGRFGPYLEIELDDKKKRASIPKVWNPDDVDLDKAIKLLSLPRVIGQHPEDNQDIITNIGRYGPFIQHEKKYARLSSVDEVFTVGINFAVDALVNAKVSTKKTVKSLRDLDKHPELQAQIQIFDGRYGPYLKCAKINVSLPQKYEIAKITNEEAIELINNKIAKGSTGRGKKATKKVATKKTATAKTATKKTATKKTATAKTATATAKKAATAKTATAKKTTKKSL